MFDWGGFSMISSSVVGWAAFSIVLACLLREAISVWKSLTVIGLIQGWVLVKTFIVEYPMSKEFPMSFLMVLFVGCLKTRMLDSWFSKFLWEKLPI